MNDPKSRYLAAFEATFTKLCGGHRAAAGWSQGMWCNAHMYFGMGVSSEEGAKRFFDDIMKYASNRRKLKKLQSMPG